VELRIRRASKGELEELVAWQYDPPYDFYDDDGVPPNNPERYYAARDEEGRFVGFYYFEQRGDVLEYGLGLRPELTGIGLGLDFVLRGLAFGRRRFRPARIVLAVAGFNERAIKVYERAGFRVSGRHSRRFEKWGEVEFVDMEEAR
jgi:RimJ/RimL family protein N-acetyltransferase